MNNWCSRPPSVSPRKNEICGSTALIERVAPPFRLLTETDIAHSQWYLSRGQVCMLQANKISVLVTERLPPRPQIKLMLEGQISNSPISANFDLGLGANLATRFDGFPGGYRTLLPFPGTSGGVLSLHTILVRAWMVSQAVSELCYRSLGHPRCFILLHQTASNRSIQIMRSFDGFSGGFRTLIPFPGTLGV